MPSQGRYALDHAVKDAHVRSAAEVAHEIAPHAPHAARVQRAEPSVVECIIDDGNAARAIGPDVELGLDQAWEQIGTHLRDPGRFERGLQRLLDGIEVGLRSR